MSKWSSRFSQSISIEGRRVGEDAPTYVVAEIGANHDGKLPRAIELIRAAADAGADAVKFQTLDFNALFHEPTTDDDIAQLYDRIELPEDWYPELKEEAEKHGVAFFASVTYRDGIRLLSDVDVPAYKIASAQVAADTELIEAVASEDKPLILSTGLGGYAHVERALGACLEAGNEDVAVLHCISEYPTPIDKTELRRIERLKAAFGAITGFSDHTESVSVPCAAVALGADVIEKHITVDRSLEGPDHGFAVEPVTFSKMVDGVREVERALGSGLKLTANEEEEWLREHVEMKLVAAEDIAEGTALSCEIVTSRRSPKGVSRDFLDELVRANVSVKRDLQEGSLITWDCITGDDDR